MGVLGLDRALGVGARARVSPALAPLFSGPLTEEGAGLERSINFARIVGVPLVVIGIASGQVVSPLAPILIALLAGTSIFVALALRGAPGPRARVVLSLADLTIIAVSQLMTIDREPWTSPAASFLAIIVIAFRSGRGGALLSAVAASGIFLGQAAYREAVVGIPTTPVTTGGWLTLYLLCALIMSFVVGELGALREREWRQRERDVALLDAQSDLGELLLVTDGDRILESNHAMARLSGRTLEGPLPLSELFDAEDITRIRARSETGTTDQFELTMRRPDGERLGLEMAVKRVQRDGGRTIAVARDITDRKRVESALEHQVLHDRLTGLASRALLQDRISRSIAGAGSIGAVTVLMLDVADFRNVNDTLGFHAGDAVLRALASRLEECVRPADTVARLGGDEFAVVLDGSGPKPAERAIAAILRSLEQPVMVEGSSVAIDVRIGAAIYPDHGADADTLLRHAEFAMYEAKLAGTRSATYAPEHGATAPTQLVVAEVRAALERDEIILFYQPQVRLSDGATIGVEALARWQHPRHGLLTPSEFIPLIEGTTVWRAFSDRVILKALADRRSWPNVLRDLRIAVNLSGQDLLDPTLPATVGMYLGAEERGLAIEVTERGIASDSAPVRRTLSALSAMGVSFSIDDFGTGESSLSHLVHLPVSEVKIDRSFVMGMRTDPKHRAIVRATIELAHALGTNVVAEGIEDAPTWELLGQMGCDAAQGYFVSRPMPADAVAGWPSSGWRPSGSVARN